MIGLQPGDVITHLNNQAIESTKQFTEIAKALPKNRSVSMRFCVKVAPASSPSNWLNNPVVS
jgi:type II secretory pathway component PulC